MDSGSTLDEKPKIFLMGLRRSGKSSIQKVVFHKMAPTETLYLESTNKIEKNGNCFPAPLISLTSDLFFRCFRLLLHQVPDLGFSRSH
ncbi:unnamed protein product [Dibothriocephalus latus]|uniref:GTP-binding protein n=1 Tax=Dibothriocephalus latus TaxID=60516 RepID=A0A3P7NN97_DIBLA|nr:unnamed protein product [Dibothriocephalus latus]